MLKRNSIETYLVAGLGNPGPEYEMTRHNCGFRALDLLAEKMKVELTKHKFRSICGDTKLTVGNREVRVLLMKPQTFMNNSGEAVSEAVNFYKVPEKNVIVIYDDCDVDVGLVRVRAGGSAGSHNGMKSVVSYMSNMDFPRVRVGIGKKMPNADMIKFVLGTFPPEEEKQVAEALKNAADAAYTIITEGVDRSMNRYNGKHSG